MKVPRAFHPPLFAAFPVLAIFAANAALFPVVQLVRPILLAVVLGLAAWACVAVMVRNWNRSAIAASVLILSFFSFDWIFGRLIEDDLSGRVLLAWALASISVASLAAWKFRWHRFANMLSIFLCVVSSGSIAYSSIRKVSSSPRVAVGTRFAKSSLPDILYIVLDGYGRSDQLRRAIGYNDEWFICELEQRGFYVADRSHSNYSQTDLSLASTLNMDTVQNLFATIDPRSNDRIPMYLKIDDNRVANELRKLGYVYVGVRSGYPGIRFETADFVPESGPRTTLFEATILQLTPLRVSSRAVESLFNSRRRDLTRALERLEELSAPSSSPRFIVAHILAPHPPFVFGPNGEAVQPLGVFGYFDGSHYIQMVGDEASYKKGYSGQAEFIAKKVLKIVDAFIAKAKEMPVIIVQGDHGSKAHLDQHSLANSDVHECFGILNAFFVPDDLKQTLYPEITSINTFRWLLSTLFRKDISLLPDRSFYSPSDRPLELTEVTHLLRTADSPGDSVALTGR